MTTMILDGIALGGKSDEELEGLFWWHYDKIPWSFDVKKAVVCLDSPDSSKRVKKTLKNVGYKANRRPATLLYLDSFQRLIDSLESFGIETVVSPIMAEADDCICDIVATNPNIEYKIYTTDKDLCLVQYLYPNAKTFVWERTSQSFMSAQEYVLLKFEVGLESFQDYLALVGDRCDDWAGMKGFGKVAFKKFLELENCEREKFLEKKGFSLPFARFIVTPCTFAELKEVQEAQEAQEARALN